MNVNLLNISNKAFYGIFIVLAFVIYGNGINNEYSLDDDLVVFNNQKVEQGISSIYDIFTTRSQKANKNTIYRPLPIASFAIEKQLFSELPRYQTKKEKKQNDKITQANISHFINLIFYIITCVLLFNVLRTVFKEYNVLLPFTIVLIFLTHPLHTEPVNNLKSRDELLMLLFVLLSLQQYLKFSLAGKYYRLFIAFVFLLLAQFSKQNGIAILGILPVFLYFIKVSYKKIGVLLLVSMAAIFSFSMFKINFIGAAPRAYFYYENPLLFEGNIIDRISVGFYCAFFYLKMLLYPKNLSFYYGYSQIPMADFSYWQVWASMLVFIPTGIYGFYLFIKRNVLGLGIVLWFGVMMGVINVFFPIVGIVADRFTYMFSIGYCIVVGGIILKAFKLPLDKGVSNVKVPYAFFVVISLIIIVYSVRVIDRNNDWHDHLTLYDNDIEHLENSAKAHAILSNTLYPLVMNKIRTIPNDKSINGDIDRLIFHYHEAIRIDSNYLVCLNNLGSVYSILKRNYKQAIYYSNRAVKINPLYLEAHFNLAFSYDALNDYNSALYHYLEVIKINSNYENAYIKLGLLLSKNNKLEEGVMFLNEIAEKESQPKQIYLNIANLISRQGEENIDAALVYFVKSFNQDKQDSVLCEHIIKLYEMKSNQEKIDCYKGFIE